MAWIIKTPPEGREQNLSKPSKGYIMDYLQAIEFLQNHLDSLEEPPEVLAQWGDCIVGIDDHVKLLEAALLENK